MDSLEDFVLTYLHGYFPLDVENENDEIKLCY